jgi:hypothetical protein
MTALDIDPWKKWDDERITEAYRSRRSDPGFPALEAKALARGYKPAPLSMGLDYGQHDHELYTWCGEVWVKA